jgi:hypothetical protein
VLINAIPGYRRPEAAMPMSILGRFPQSAFSLLFAASMCSLASAFAPSSVMPRISRTLSSSARAVLPVLSRSSFSTGRSWEVQQASLRQLPSQRSCARFLCSTVATDAEPKSGGLALAGGRMKVKQIFDSADDIIGNEVVVKGWVRTCRSQKTFSFIEVNDGSTPKGIQV